jgi:predicted transcriptional regulator
MQESAVNAVQPSGLTKIDIEALAERFADQVHYQPGSDLHSLIEQLGGQIEIHDLNELGRTGSIHVRGPGEFTIFLPPYTSRLRDRFTIAHELGHYVLHSRFGKQQIRVMREGGGRTEWEANWFAAAFLMPAAEFRKVAPNKTDAEIALHFDVSLSAVEVRKRTVEG